MSRSKRKPYFTEGYGGCHRQKDKRNANKCVRKSNRQAIDDFLVIEGAQTDNYLADGNSYRKHYNSLDICDWKFYSPDQEKAKRK